ncbi:MAG: RHS repeat-associated core domain-containing protein [Hahellaceae bacterium]|nr:RHS repeat-associated core domain-containing protein [Hahellaceae bacterium]
MVTDQSQAVIWQTEQTPFGEVTQTTGTLAQPLRFPGQYADPETGYSYNYFRDYDPSVGRYVQSDPIGLRGGLNTYGYVYQNPLIRIDPFGLEVGDWWDLPANFGHAYDLARYELARPGHGGHNDHSDASRHSEWSRRMCEEINPFTSWAAGVGHEIDGLLNGQPWNEFMMDLHNNQEGRNAASEGRPVDPSNLVTSPDDAGSIIY